MVVVLLLRQCFAQSRLCDGSSAPLTEVRGTCSLCFSLCGLILSLSGRVFQADFLSLTYGGEIVSLFPLINARCVTPTSVAFSTNGGLPQTKTVVQLSVYANALPWQRTAHSYTWTRRVDTPLSS